MYDLLHISMEPWRPVWRRNQNLASTYAKRFPSHTVLYVEPARDLSNALRRGRLREVWQGWRVTPPERCEELANVLIFVPTKLLPNTIAVCRWVNRLIERRQVRAAARIAKLHDPVLYINPYYAAHMPGRMGERAVVYDIGDDWTAFQQPTALARRTDREDRFLSERCDGLIVVSPRLRDLKQPWRDKLHLIPNGVDVAKYQAIGRPGLEPHPITAGWPRPVLGHTGTLQPQRSDVDLMIQLARRFPEGTLALVGPNDLDAQSTRRLRDEPNVRLTGPVPHAQVPRVMAAFDVCVVPHRVSDFSESQCPLKLFEYMASGLPIVSTLVSGFRDYRGLVRLAEDADGFARQVREALAEPASERERRRAAAAEHSWDARVDAFVRVLDRVASARTGVAAEVSSGRQATGDIDLHSQPEPTR